MEDVLLKAKEKRLSNKLMNLGGEPQPTETKVPAANGSRKDPRVREWSWSMLLM